MVYPYYIMSVDVLLNPSWGKFLDTESSCVVLTFRIETYL